MGSAIIRNARHKSDWMYRARDNHRTVIYEIGICILFGIIGFLIYSNVLYAPFVFDDKPNILENNFIQIKEISWQGIKEILKCPKGFEPRPVSYLTFAINYYFNGFHPLGYHVVNIVIHILNAICLYYFLKLTLTIFFSANGKDGKLLENMGFQLPHIPFISFFSALIWLTHPLHTQSVTFIVQRMTSLAALFFLVSCICFVKGRLAQFNQNQNIRTRIGNVPKHWLWFSGSVISGLLAFGSKQNTAVLPFFLLLYEWYFFKKLREFKSVQILKWFAVCFVILIGASWFYLGNNPTEKFNSLYQQW